MKDLLKSFLTVCFKHCIVNKQTLEDGITNMLTSDYNIFVLDIADKFEVTCKNKITNKSVIINCLMKGNVIVDFDIVEL